MQSAALSSSTQLNVMSYLRAKIIRSSLLCCSSLGSSRKLPMMLGGNGIHTSVVHLQD